MAFVLKQHKAYIENLLQFLLKTLKMELWRKLIKKGSSISTIGKSGSACTFHKFAKIENAWNDPTDSNCWWPTDDILGTETFHLTNIKFAPKPSKWHFELSA